MLIPTTRIEPLLAVATSVSADTAFDPLDTLSFASSHEFHLIQAYLHPQLCDDHRLRKSLVEQAAQLDISLITHAPGLLAPSDALAPAVVAAAKDVRHQGRPWVVYHL